MPSVAAFLRWVKADWFQWALCELAVISFTAGGAVLVYCSLISLFHCENVGNRIEVQLAESAVLTWS